MDVRIEHGWKKALSHQWDEPYFHTLTDFIRQEYNSTTVFPPASRIFAAFDSCPYDNTRVVIIGQDPYHDYGQANGLCFSVNDGVPAPPSLINILREVSDDTGSDSQTSYNLERWARQGVLLLNSVLTVRAHQAGSHRNHGWETFTDAVVNQLASERDGLVFMLWGSYAIKKGAFIDRKRHLVLTSPHPSPLSAHRGFFGNHHFSQCNAWLTAHGQSPIAW